MWINLLSGQFLPEVSLGSPRGLGVGVGGRLEEPVGRKRVGQQLS